MPPKKATTNNKEGSGGGAKKKEVVQANSKKAEEAATAPTRASTRNKEKVPPEPAPMTTSRNNKQATAAGVKKSNDATAAAEVQQPSESKSKSAPKRQQQKQQPSAASGSGSGGGSSSLENNNTTNNNDNNKMTNNKKTVGADGDGPSAPKKPKVAAKSTANANGTLLSVDSFTPKLKAELVLTCGNGDVGQLGHGEQVTIAKRPRPVKSFPEGTRFVQVVAGGMHTVLLTSDYEVFTCGCNDEGALGRRCYEEDEDGQLEEADKDEDFLFRKVPFPEGHKVVVMISAGDSHTAALTREGDVFVWGTFRDKGGLLGLALKKDRRKGGGGGVGEVVKKTKEPYLLSSNKDRVVVKIASGSDHIAMLTADGRVLTSGAGDAGQLGRLTPHSRDSAISRRTVAKMMTPAEITVKRSMKFSDICCATYCSFARSAVDGKIFVWGLNNYCQLGVADPEKTDIHFPMVSERFGSDKIWKWFAGDHHILAVDASGECFGIGRGDDCKLGQGAEQAGNSDQLVSINSIDNPNDLVIGVAGSTGTSFLWTESGKAYGWGANNEAELGLGVDEDSVVEKPTLLEVRSVDGGVKIVSISANAQHAVFLANRPNQ